LSERRPGIAIRTIHSVLVKKRKQPICIIKEKRREYEEM